MPDIPGYTIIRPIGSGGSARVYLAVQHNLNRRVALKLVRGTLVADASFEERFRREGRIIAQLNHPHIIPVYDIGTHHDYYYLAMEHLDGGDLRSQAGRLTTRTLLDAMIQVTGALQAAHEQGFVHRDIKPANILFRNPEQAVLTDFGIARKTESLTRMTVTGAMLGTPAYMSPEQINGDTLDGRADLYSLGVTLFEMLCGYLPYRGESMMSVALQHTQADIPRLPAAVSRFQKLIDRLLAKNAADRISDAEALRTQLQGLRDRERASPEALLSLWPDKIPPDDARYTVNTAMLGAKKNRALKWLAALALGALVLSAVLTKLFQADPVPADDNVTRREQPQIPQAQADAITLTPEVIAPAPESSAEPAPEPAWRQTLARADRLYHQGQLIEPATDNALTLYRQVLAQHPDNIAAANGARNILQREVTELEQLIQARSLTQAEQHLSTLRSLWLDDPSLQALQERIDETRQTIRAAELAAELAAAAAQRQQQIDRHLQAATAAMIEGRYLKPRADSAFYHFDQIVRLQPGHSLATRGLAQVKDAQTAGIDKAISDQQFDQAAALIDDLRGIAPDTAALAGLVERLDAARNAFEQERIRQQHIAALNRDIDQIQDRVERWQQSESEADVRSRVGDVLVSDINGLLAQAPDNSGLQRLLTQVQNQLDRLAAQQAPPVTEPAPRPVKKPLIGGF